MKKTFQAPFSIVVLLVILVSAGGCGNSALRDNEERKQILGKEFITELIEDILPYREMPDYLPEVGVIVANNRKTAQRQWVQDFYDEYKKGGECVLTAAFYTENQLVFIRVHFVNKYEGYYYYYKVEEGLVEVTPKPVNGLEITEDPEVGKTVLALKQNKKSIATFTFYDLDGPF